MAYVARHLGKVDDKGQLVLSNPIEWRAAVAKHKGREVYVTVRRVQHMRSPNQNRYYWGVVIEHIAGCIGESAEETHELLKHKFLGSRRIELLDGQALEMPPSTRILTVEQFTAYIEQIRVWAAQFLGLSIPEANEVEVVI